MVESTKEVTSDEASQVGQAVNAAIEQDEGNIPIGDSGATAQLAGPVALLLAGPNGTIVQGMLQFTLLLLSTRNVNKNMFPSILNSH